MAVANDGIFGSIGGGIMEHKFVELAKEKLILVSVDPLIRKQFHSKTPGKDQSGMVCSGDQTIVLFQLNERHIDTVERIMSSLLQNQNGLLKISPDDFSFSNFLVDGPDKNFEMQSETNWKYTEVTGYRNHLYIIGGGHCSLAFSRIMRDLGFYIHVYDERKELNTISVNTFAHEITIVENYASLTDLIPSGKNNYVVIMTFGYRTDDLALRSLIKKDFSYLGVLGSNSKINKMFEEWRRDQLPEDKLEKLHAPIGLKIFSHTPEEIAISIAAEIIAVKNGS